MGFSRQSFLCLAPVRHLSTGVALLAMLSIAGAQPATASDPTVEGVSSREAKQQAIQCVPFQRLGQSTAEVLKDVLENPSFYRRMPTQTIQCDPELFSFLVRKPEVMVNTWDLMGITKVTAKRTGPFSFLANDGVGTNCKCDLVYGNENLHIYYGVGNYDGTMTPRTVKGRCVCILRSESQPFPDGHSGHVVHGTMDVFLKLDNLGADLLTRTFGSLVAKTADHNFVETAQFVSQLSQVCAKNPPAAMGLASQLNDIDEPVRQEFVTIASKIAEAAHANARQLAAAATNNDALTAQTLEELRVATAAPTTLTAEPNESPDTTYTAYSSRQGHSQPASSSQASMQLSDGSGTSSSMPRPPANLLPKKTSATMRR